MKSIINKNKWLIIFTPILKSVEVIFELIIPIIIIDIINEKNKTTIILYASLILILYIIGFITSVISQYLASLTAHKIGHELRQETFKKILYNKNYNYSKQTNIITSDIKQIVTGINVFIRLGLRAPVLMIGSIIMSFLIDKKSSIIFLISTLVIAVFITLIIKICSYINNKILNEKDSQLKRILNIIDGIKTIRIYGKTEYEQNKLIRQNKKIKNDEIMLEQINSLSSPITYLVMQTSSIMILLLIDNNVEGETVALINYMNQILLSITLLIKSLLILIKSLDSKKRVDEIINEEIILPNETKIEKIDTLEYIDVDGINFKLEKNMTLGIIGSTGSGKTTLVNYINNKNNPGTILINGQDIKEIDYKGCLGNVFQKPVLFNETLEYNIALNSKKDIKKVMKEMNLNLENKMIDEKGKNLSGGEKQRIILARQILKKPSLYILDDAQSALDYKTEKQILNKLKEDKNSKKIIISSRINTIKDCDLILFMDEKIVGTHQENMKNEKYKKLFESQKVEV